MPAHIKILKAERRSRRMSVPESKRGHGKFEVLTKANELAVYTIRITKNQKVFKPEYRSAVTDDIVHTANDIYIKCWSANNIRVGEDAEKWKERKHLQESAIQDCNNLLALMDLAQKVFHLETRRIKYWGGKTVEVREYVRKWKEGDSKRYAKMK